jgi:hypothetical protein
LLLLLTALLTASAFAAERGTVIRKTNLYVSTDTTSAKLATADRGRDAVVLERAPGWLKVIATLTDAPYNPDPDVANTRNVTGWIQEKSFIGEKTPNGDQILFGEAEACEDEASSAHARKGAADDARWLYFRVYDVFPTSPLAGEALYRAADIQWQLDKADMQSRRSYKEAQPGDRPPIEDHALHMVEKKFPGTKWADLAAYDMLDNKLCGDWAGSSKCPEKEAEIYEHYGDEHPNSPKAAEAYCNAAYRWAAIMTIVTGEGKAKRVPEAQGKAIAVAQKALAKNTSPEMNARAQRLLYMVQHNVAVYGSGVD